MANRDDKDEPEWMRRVKSEGAVPLLEPGNCLNGWASPPGEKFMVRGPEYFATRVKVPASEYLLMPLGFDWIKGSTKIANILRDRNYRIRKEIDNAFQGGDKPFVWAFNLQVPSKENYSAIAYFVSTEPCPEGSLVEQFLKGDDGFRNSRLKLIANIVKGPWIVRKAVGEQAICIIGRALNCKYCVGKDFLEVDIDIGSSVVASAIVHLAFGYITTLTVDLAFLIESQTDSELPEKLLGGFRFSELQPDSAQSYEASSAEITPTSTPRLGMRLWKTLGQGFSQLLHQGAPESVPDSASPCTNVTLENDDDTEDIKKPHANVTGENDDDTEDIKKPQANVTPENDDDTEEMKKPHTNVTPENDDDIEDMKKPHANVTPENDDDTGNIKKPHANGTQENDDDTEDIKKPHANVTPENDDDDDTEDITNPYTNGNRENDDYAEYMKKPHTNGTLENDDDTEDVQKPHIDGTPGNDDTEDIKNTSA